MPIIVIDILFIIFLYCSFVEFERDDGSRKSSACSDFISVLIENYESLRFGISECIENIFKVGKREIEVFLSFIHRLKSYIKFRIQIWISERFYLTIVMYGFIEMILYG